MDCSGTIQSSEIHLDSRNRYAFALADLYGDFAAIRKIWIAALPLIEHRTRNVFWKI